LILFFNYYKEQQTVKVAFDDGVAAENAMPSTSCPKEGMSGPYSTENVWSGTSCPKEGMYEPYMVIHSYSQLLTVRFKTMIFHLSSEDLDKV
jgi:hypothetical protein